MHERKRIRTVAVHEVQLRGRVLRDRRQRLQRLESDIPRRVRQRLVDLLDLVRLRIRQELATLGLFLRGSLVRFRRGDRLLLDEVERFAMVDGTLTVTPIANGIPRDTFTLDAAASSTDDVWFTRQGEGFPQQLQYRRVGDELQVVARDTDQALGIKLRPGPCL